LGMVVSRFTDEISRDIRWYDNFMRSLNIIITEK